MTAVRLDERGDHGAISERVAVFNKLADMRVLGATMAGLSDHYLEPGVAPAKMSATPRWLRRSIARLIIKIADGARSTPVV